MNDTLLGVAYVMTLRQRWPSDSPQAGSDMQTIYLLSRKGESVHGLITNGRAWEDGGEIANLGLYQVI